MACKDQKGCNCGCQEHHHCHDHEEEGCCCCCDGKVDVDEIPKKGLTSKQKSDLIKICIAFAFLVLLKVIEPYVESFYMSACGMSADGAKTASYFTNLILYGIDYLFIGHKVLAKAGKNILKGKIFDENFLMVVATLGAVFLGIIGNGEFTEAVAVMVFYQLGEWFEGYAVGRSKKNITDLMDIRPDYANVDVDGKIKRVDPASIEVGGIIVVNPGEKVPIDGVVVEGSSSLDTSSLTGESVPRMANLGDEVVSGCICESGVLKIKTTKVFGESTVSKILELVQNASSNKSQKEAFISRFAKYYTPCVCVAALCLGVVAPLFLMLLGWSVNWFDWIYRALTFLVISCPCALVISIPLSFFAGIGCASKNGVLIKGSNYLEALTKLDTIVFDKTGTLTKGVFDVVEIAVSKEGEKILSEVVPDVKFEDKENVKLSLLYFAACAELASNHPIAKSICNAFNDANFKEIDIKEISDQKEVSAGGVSAKVGEVEVKVGKPSFVCEEKFESNISDSYGSVVYVSVNEVYAGYILISDVVKDTSKDAISLLKSCGVKKTVMLTGDNLKAAKSVADQMGIDSIYAELLPQDKVEQVEALKTNALNNGDKRDKVAFVGDGINDAPVLMSADVGIAMGGIGSDAAIEAADIVLMDDDPLSIPKSLRIAYRCMRIVNENIIFALLVKFSCLILGALGIANMYMAIFADVGVMVIAVINAMRALTIKK